jgi:predicted nucleotidyltransferase
MPRLHQGIKGKGSRAPTSDFRQDCVIAWAQNNGSVRELWLFGSRAKGEAKAGSDLDVGMV